MATTQIVKQLAGEYPSKLQVLDTFVFGDKNIDFYDSTKTYNTNDLILYRDPLDNTISILQALFDNITGAFDITKWEAASVADVVSSSGSKMISFDDTQPIHSSNVIWNKPVVTKTMNIPNIITGIVP